MSALSNITVCITGFDAVEQNEIQTMVTEMKGIFKVDFTKKISVLISNKINTQKCLIAESRNIPVVTKKWIQKVYENKKFYDYSKYKIKPLQGMTICLFGYNNEIEAFNSLKNKIIGLNGEISKIQDDIDEHADIIIVKQGILLKKMEINLLEKFSEKMVTEDWLFDTIAKNEYISELKKYKFKNNYIKQNFEKIETDLLLEFKDWDSIKPLFKDLIFYLSPNLDKNLKKVLKQAISLGQGIICEKQTVITTHVICNLNTDIIIKHNFSNQIIVNPIWIIDCLKQKKLLSIEEYKPYLQEQIATNNNLTINKEELMNKKVVSSIFKGKTFYVETNSYNPEQSQLVHELIVTNSGKFINSLDKSMPNFLVINDGFTQLNHYLKEYQNCEIISDRFITKCIEQKELIDNKKLKYIHLLPYSTRIPLDNFADKVICFMGYDILEKEIFEYFAETLGASIEFSKNTTHVICNVNDPKMIEKVKSKTNIDTKFVTIEWLLDCLCQGSAIPEDDRLITQNSNE